jgi:ferredoxin
MKKVIGIGETILDILFKDNQPMKAVPGGSVFNSIISLGRMGASVIFVSEVGSDRVGDIVIDSLLDSGVDASYIYRYDDAKSPVSLAFLDNNNDAEYIFHKGAPATHLDVEFPNIEADDIVIMNKCLCRNSTECTNYPRDLGCLFMGKTTRKISRRHCREVTRQEAIEHIDKCAEAGLIHIMGRNKMDSVWMGVGPNEELLTVCNCCPCCCLWRVYPDLSDTIQNDFFKLPGVSIQLDVDDCVGCGKCQEVCFAKCIEIENSKAVIDENICIGCGQCSNNCPTNAIKLIYDKKDVESVFDKINSLVNIKS